MPMMTQVEIEAAIREVFKKSISDPTFRKLAINDGSAALGKVTSKTLPPGIEFRFLDNSGNVKTVTLPDPVSGSEELSELELEQVAGGCEIASCFNTGC